MDQAGAFAFGILMAEGYGIFSVSASGLESVRKYILAQEEHHRMRTFQDEYRALLDKSGVQYDERFLW